MSRNNNTFSVTAFICCILISLGFSGTARADSTVVFNEIMYHPADDSVPEWIEFYNQMAVDMDLSGWSVQGGIRYVFPQGSIVKGGAYLVLAAAPAALPESVGRSQVFGPFSGKLANSGESLELVSRNQRMMDRIDYDDEGAWPVAPDGSGVSLAKLDPDLGSAQPASWGYSEQVGGSPGQPNTARQGRDLTGLRFNEIVFGGQVAFNLELYNAGDSATELQGHVLTSTDPRDARYVLGKQSLASGAYLVLDELRLGFRPAPGSPLFLYDPSQLKLIAAAQVSDRTLALDAQGSWGHPTLPSPGRPNSHAYEKRIVINEVMYHAYPLAETVGTAPTYQTTTLIPINGSWRYNATGMDLGPDWYKEVHAEDQQNWLSGPAILGREEEYLPEPIGTFLRLSRRHVTFYFETEFELAEAAQVDRLQLKALIDDGAVFYLNGQRIHQINMPAGVVTAQTLAASTIGNASYSDWIDIDTDTLKQGTNLLSAEVHQITASSSDLVFGLELVAREIMIPGLPGRPFQDSAEEWIELYNRGPGPVDLSAWQFSRGVQYEFPPGTVMPASSYLVLARDVNAFTAKYPEAAAACVGNFSGRLANEGECLRLQDAEGNVADELHYYDRGYWPRQADGGASSLELRDPAADNARVSAWAASREGPKSAWVSYAYTGVAQEDGIGTDIWDEFVMGLLSQGELLLDDISVLEDPNGGHRELIQNGDFELDALDALPRAWRLLGTHGSHGRSRVTVDPDDPSNLVLHLVATGPTKDTHDHAETTLVPGARIRAGRTYRIAFRAKWLAGSNQLNTRLYFNWLQRKTSLEVPRQHGTPGAQNSVWEANIGPTCSALSHDPVIPTSRARATVSVRVQDNDGVDTVRIWYSVNGEPYRSLPMEQQGQDLYQAAIPSYEGGKVVQFYVEALDAHPQEAQMSWYPPAGPASRALYVVQDGAARLGKLHNLRIIMTPADEALLYRNTNLLSNDRLDATVVYDERTVFYDVGVRMKGSGWGRTHVSERGYNLRFAPNQLFRGVHETISIERGGSKREIVAKHMFNAAGGGLGNLYDDVAHVIAPRDRGVGLLSMARYTSLFLKSQYENGGEGTLYNYELLYTPTTTVNGDPEALKLNFPYTHARGSFDLTDYGNDKETYRWFEQIRNNRVKDDYSLLIALSQACALNAAALEERIEQVMDVSQWMRTFAMESLCGNDDFYGRAHDHNLRMYQRPRDNKMVALPWDLDRAFRLSTGASLWPMRLNLRKVIELPAYKRLYYGHLRDMISRTCNQAYMTHWTGHYGAMIGESFSAQLSYIRDRSNYVLSRLPDNAEHFTITDTDFATEDTEAIINGEAGIGIEHIFLSGSEQPLAVTWRSSGNGRNERFFWQARIALAPGVNRLLFQTLDFQGNAGASDSITVTRTAGQGQ